MWIATLRQASDLHMEVRLRMYNDEKGAKSGAAKSQSPLGAVPVPLLVKTLSSALPGNRPIVAIYDDCDERGGSVLIRICISDVSYLYRLRGALMLGDFGGTLSGLLQICVRVDAADGGLTLKLVDKQLDQNFAP